MSRGALAAVLAASALAAETTLWVAPGGRDSNSGARTAPLATLEQARDAARRAAKPARVVLRRGAYRLAQTLELGPQDSDTRWEAAPGEAVRVTGSRRVGGFGPVEDAAIRKRLKPEARDKVLVSDLRAQGITDFGRLVSRGFGRPVSPAHAELFFQGKRMTLARWPNGAFATISGVGDPDPPDDEHGRRHGRLDYGFYFGEPRPGSWAHPEEAWVHGYWSWDWANSYEAVESLDPAKGFVKTRPPHGLYGFRVGQRFFFLNVLEELDAPGEYYVDAAAGRLYFWPPAPLAGAEVELSVLNGPLIAIRGASGVTLSGWTLEATRATALEVHDSERVRVENCVVRNTGNLGIAIRGGWGNTVDGCEVYQTGDAPIHITGGDRKTLRPGLHAVINNDIHHIAEWSRTYQPGVRVEGVGHRVAHNRIHEGPHSGIQINGNEHLIEYNEIFRVALETGDVGAFYMGRDWTERGHQIRYNYFHHTGGVGMGSMGVYLDDCASGSTVTGNLFYKVQRAAFIGGGRDHVVENNVFVDCNPAVHIDGRGVDPRPVWQNMVNKTMRERLLLMDHLAPPYSVRYPELRTLDPWLAAGAGVPPENNLVVRNICWGGKWLNRARTVGERGVEFRDNLIDTDPLFVDAAREDFRLKPTSPAFAIGFRPLPLDDIGPRRRR